MCSTESTTSLRNIPSICLLHLLPAIPKISVMYQELLISLARYTFLLEVKASVEYSGKAKGVDVSFFNLDNVLNSSPCSIPLTNWVIELARDQVLIFSRKVDDCNLFCQLDGGQKGQEVVASMTNPNLKQLKEGMVEAFLKKMRLQII